MYPVVQSKENQMGDAIRKKKGHSVCTILKWETIKAHFVCSIKRGHKNDVVLNVFFKKAR